MVTVAYAHVPDELRKKLDKKGQKCIFVGYFENKKAYKLYDPVARKFIIICYIQFVVNESWDGIVEKNVKIASTVEHDDMAKEVVQTQHVSKNVTASLTPRKPRHVSTQETLTQVAAQAMQTSTP